MTIPYQMVHVIRTIMTIPYQIPRVLRTGTIANEQPKPHQSPIKAPHIPGSYRGESVFTLTGALLLQ